MNIQLFRSEKHIDKFRYNTKKKYNFKCSAKTWYEYGWHNKYLTSSEDIKHGRKVLKLKVKDIKIGKRATKLT